MILAKVQIANPAGLPTGQVALALGSCIWSSMLMNTCVRALVVVETHCVCLGAAQHWSTALRDLGYHFRSIDAFSFGHELQSSEKLVYGDAALTFRRCLQE